MPEVDPIDVLLRISNLRKFVADALVARDAIAGVQEAGIVGTAGKSSASSVKNAEKARAAQQAAALGLVRKAAIGTGLAVAAIGFEAAKMGMKFETEMFKIRSQAGASTGELKLMNREVLAMGKWSQQGPEALAKALYMIESVGLRGARAVATLKAASRGAALGGADIEHTANALASAAVSYELGPKSMENTMAILDATVGVGKMRMEELVQSMKTGILPVAALAHLSLRSLGAALAIMTDRGIDASRGMRYLRQAIFYLANESTGPAKKALKELGLTQEQVAHALASPDGLYTVVELLHEHMRGMSSGKQLEMIKALGGGARSASGLAAVYQSIGSNVSSVQGKYAKIGELTGSYHARLKEQEQLPSAQIAKAWSAIRTDMIEVGKSLAKLVVIGVKALYGLAQALLWVVNAAKSMKHWFEQASGPVKAIVTVVAIMIGQAALMMTVVTAWKLLQNAILASKIAIEVFSSATKLAFLTTPWGIAIMAIITLVILMATHWTRTKEIAIQVWNAMKEAWKATVAWIVGAAETVFNFFKNHWPLLAGILLGPFGFVVAEAIKHWKGLLKFFESIPGVIGKIASTIWEAFTWPFRWALKSMEQLWNKFIHLPGISQIMGAVKWAGSGLESAASAVGSVIPGLAYGGVVSSPGAVLVGESGPEIVHLGRGASVQPLSTRPSPAADIPMIQVKAETHLNDKVLAESIGTYTADKVARR